MGLTKHISFLGVREALAGAEDNRSATRSPLFFPHRGLWALRSLAGGSFARGLAGAAAVLESLDRHLSG